MNAIKKICGVPLTATPTRQLIFKGAKGNETVEVRASYRDSQYTFHERSLTKFNSSTVDVTSPIKFPDLDSANTYLINLNQRFNKGTGACAIKN
jgi:hypothetical protein